MFFFQLYINNYIHEESDFHQMIQLALPYHVTSGVRMKYLKKLHYFSHLWFLILEFTQIVFYVSKFFVLNVNKLTEHSL